MTFYVTPAGASLPLLMLSKRLYAGVRRTHEAAAVVVVAAAASLLPMMRATSAPQSRSQERGTCAF